MKTKKDFIAWIEKQIEYYKPILGLELNEITVKESSDGYLSMKFTYPYIDTVLMFSDDAYKDWLKKDLKKDRILHELCHIITDPLYSKATDRYLGKNELEDERENLVDKLASIIRRLDNN